jgi:hypothetical protein
MTLLCLPDLSLSIPLQGDNYKGCDKTNGLYFGEGCGTPFSGVFFHLIWQLLGTYVLMQLFTGVIIENFVEVTHESASLVDRETVSASRN